MTNYRAYHDRINQMEFYYNCMKSFLGPNKSLKFLVDDDISEIVGCPAELFSRLHYKGPIGSFVNSAIQSYHEHYGHGTSTLVAMFCLFHLSLSSCLHKGYDLALIMKEVNKLLDRCVDHLTSKQCSFYNVTSFHTKDADESMQILCKDIQRWMTENTNSQQRFLPLNTSEIEEMQWATKLQTQGGMTKAFASKVLRASRHFNIKSTENFEKDTVIQLNKATKCGTSTNAKHLMNDPFPTTILERVVSISTHSEENVKHLVLKAWDNQMKWKEKHYDIRFLTELIHTVPMLGDRASSCVIPGIVMPLTSEQINLASKVQTCRALLIAGDLSFNSKHKGFKQTLKSSPVLSKLGEETEELTWLHKVMDILKKLNVNLLLVNGLVLNSLIDSCLSANIIVIEKVPKRILNSLATEYEMYVETYITNCDQENVIPDVKVLPWNLNRLQKTKDFAFLQILLNQKFQTVVISESSMQISLLEEHKFWHLANRLSSCTSLESKIIHGKGKAEREVIDFLNLLINSSLLSINYNMVVAKEIIEQVMTDFVKLIDDNCSIGQCNVMVIDDLKSKVDAWKCASYLASAITSNTFVVNTSDEPRLSSCTSAGMYSMGSL